MGLAVSVIIASYNRPAELRQTVEDMSRQTRPPDEILVIEQSRDNSGSADDQSTYFEKYFQNVRYIHQNPPNAQRARNLGIQLASSDILVLVDDDVRLGPDFIATHLNNYLEDSTLDAVAGQTLEIGQQPTDEFPAAYSWPHTGWMHFPLNFAERRGTINWPSCNASIRREMALRIGGFDEQFIRTWWDDADFSWRLHLAGAKIVFDPCASLVHLKTPSGGKRPKGLNEFVLADTERWGILFYFWRKHFGILRARRSIWQHVRGMIFRRVLAVRPWLLVQAIYHLIAGYRWASERLRQGPIYLQQPAGTGMSSRGSTHRAGGLLQPNHPVDCVGSPTYNTERQA